MLIPFFKKRRRMMLNKLRYALNRNRCCSEAEINMEQLKKMVAQGAILVDVRSPQEFDEGHLDNAILLPEYEIKENVDQVLPDKLKVIIVYCSTGHRGQKAQQILKMLGYKKVYNLCNGFNK